MVSRRSLIQAGIALPLVTGPLIGCSRKQGPVKSFYRPALAQVHMPVRVPFGFHGSWIADGDLTAV